MSAPSKSETATIKPVHIVSTKSRYEIESLERHAASQAACDVRRKAKSAPRRDDLARAAYYVLLMMFREAEALGEPEQAARIRNRLLRAMEDALFDRTGCAVAFKDHAGTVVRDRAGWNAMRRIAKEKETAAEAVRSAAD